MLGGDAQSRIAAGRVHNAGDRTRVYKSVLLSQFSAEWKSNLNAAAANRSHIRPEGGHEILPSKTVANFFLKRFQVLLHKCKADSQPALEGYHYSFVSSPIRHRLAPPCIMRESSRGAMAAAEQACIFDGSRFSRSTLLD